MRSAAASVGAVLATAALSWGCGSDEPTAQSSTAPTTTPPVAPRTPAQQQAADGLASCPADEPPVFARLDGALAYTPVDAEIAQRLGDPSTFPGGSLQVRQLASGGVPVAFVVVLVTTDAAGYERGVRESAERGGARRRTTRLGARLAARYFVRPGTDGLAASLVVRSGCRSYAVYAADAESVIAAAEAVLGEARLG